MSSLVTARVSWASTPLATPRREKRGLFFLALLTSRHVHSKNLGTQVKTWELKLRKLPDRKHSETKTWEHNFQVESSSSQVENASFPSWMVPVEGKLHMSSEFEPQQKRPRSGKE